MGRINAKGRTRDGRHVRLYAWLTGSPAWADLSGNAVKLLIYLATWEDGSNNGELFMSTRMAAEGIGVSKKTAGKAFRELEDHGFLRAVERGYFQMKGGPATRWRLTWLSWPAASKPPSNEWRQWQPEENSRGQKFPVAGVKTTTLPENEPATGVKTTPRIAGNPQKCVEATREEITPHTVATGESSQPISFQPGNRPEIAGGQNRRLECAPDTSPHHRRRSAA